MLQLNLPEYNFKIKKEKEKLLIFDSQRRKYVVLTPEEWVRQNFIQFLIQEKGYPSAYIAIEKELILNGLKKRCDAIIYNKNGEPYIIIELKAPNVSINQKTFDQVAVYNAKLMVNLFMISNGIDHFCCKIDFKNAKYDYFTEIPSYSQII